MIAEVEKAIYAKLNGTSAVTSLLSSATAIYATQAPNKAALPYIVYIHAAGGDVNESPLDAGDLRYYVKAVANTAAQAASIAGEIRNALHRPSTMAIDSPWTVVQCQHTSAISMIENIERTQEHHKGGLYRIRISK